jgi:hypothetical protein
MMQDVYVGRLDDPQFVTGRHTLSGGVPSARSPLFPCGRAAFRALEERIERGILPGGATQHIAYVAPATKAQIAQFYADLYGTNPLTHTRPDPHPPTEASLLRAWIRDMPEDGPWCLVAYE